MKYMVKFRNIPPELMMTPLYMISSDTVMVESKEESTQWDICLAISKEFNWINPNHVRIEKLQKLGGEEQ